MTGKQRSIYRAMANTLETVMQIGKEGISDNSIMQADQILEARELAKFCVLNTSGYTAREAAQEISNELGADIIQVIGTRFVLYRKSKKEDNAI